MLRAVPELFVLVKLSTVPFVPFPDPRRITPLLPMLKVLEML